MPRGDALLSTPMNPPESTESGLREYALLLWGRKFLVLLVFVVFVGGALAYSAVAKHKYTATAELLLTPTLSPTLLEANGNLSYGSTVDVPSDSQVIESDVVKDLVDKEVPGVATAVVSEVGTTDVVDIAVTENNAVEAAKAASDYARQYINYEQQQTVGTLESAVSLTQKHVNTLHLAVTELQNEVNAAANSATAAGYQSQLTALEEENASLQGQLANYEFYVSNSGGTQSGQILSYASVPTKASSPKTLEYTVLAAIIGLVLGLGLAMLVEALAE
jgi:uncharacterized protein involved in exopolysaccharide biosynthesis